MRQYVVSIVMGLTLLALAATGAKADETVVPDVKALGPASGALDKLKALSGTWECVGEDGKIVASVTYRVASNGSAVLEEGSEMFTVYHLDGGDRLMMTHYCGAMNQPRMRTAPMSAVPDKLTFAMVDVTNLASPDAAHMSGLELAFPDADTLVATWAFSEKGKIMPMVMTLKRKKS